VTGLLLDTHVLFWYATGDSRLPAPIRDRLQSESAPLTVSVVSIFEMALALAKDRWPEVASMFPNAAQKLEGAGYTVLPITGRHVEAAANLPHHHNDPWDRLLVATAESEGLTLVTADRAVQAYAVDWLWA
jgi:PIN domain nuclease of toxin-antitoxin system